jgi:hypothetical protein
MKRRTIALAGVVIIALAAGGSAWAWRHRSATHAAIPGSAPSPGAAAPVVPAGTRIKVEVLNGTTTRGLARRATMVLRDAGFDVVLVGTEHAAGDTTLVIDRSNHPEWARLVADAMPPARVESRPDSTRYVDVTVVIGRAWRAPTQPLYP